MLRPARARRALLAPVLLICLMLVGTVPAAAYTPPVEQYTGQHGNYYFRDGAYGSHLGNIDCVYRTLDNGTHKIKRFVIRAPQVWWPDTTSANNHQHGTVGWRYRLQRTTDPDDHPWSTVFKSTIQKRTAYEGYPGDYDVADKAPFDTRTLDWSQSGNVYYRFKVTAIWFNHDGTTKGTVSHWYYMYDATFTDVAAVGYCRNKVAPL